eukprot:5613642-Ditylum_brightwellii.AAC.1
MSLREELDAIEPCLHVHPNMKTVLYAADKELSFCANHPKGHGEDFHGLIDIHHPGALLLHVEQSSGSHQDLAVEGAGGIYMNRKCWVEFLDV